METLTRPRSRKKKLKKKTLKPVSMVRDKWQNMPIEDWEKLNYGKILTILPERLEKIRKKPPFIRVYLNNIKKIEWCGFLSDIIEKNNEKLLIIQQLGIRENQKKIIEVAVTKKISIELSID